MQKDSNKYHNDIDKISHILRHSKESGHNKVSESDLQINGKGYRHHIRRGKIPEAKFIKNKKPPLKQQDKSIPLQLLQLLS